MAIECERPVRPVQIHGLAGFEIGELPSETFLRLDCERHALMVFSAARKREWVERDRKWRLSRDHPGELPSLERKPLVAVLTGILHLKIECVAAPAFFPNFNNSPRASAAQDRLEQANPEDERDEH